MANKIIVEKAANGYILSIENNEFRVVAKDKGEVGKYIAEIFASSLDFVDGQHRAIFEVDAKMEIKYK